MIAISERVLAIEVGEDGALQRLRGKRLELLLAEFNVHQQPDDLRIPPEAGAVGVIRGQEHSPGIVDEQEQFQSDGPLHGIHQLARLVCVRDDPAPGLVLHIHIAPLAPAELMEQVPTGRRP